MLIVLIWGCYFIGFYTWAKIRKKDWTNKLLNSGLFVTTMPIPHSKALPFSILSCDTAFTLPFKNNRVEKVKVRRPSYSSYDGRRTMCMTAVARRVRQPPHHEKTARKMATKALKILNKTLRNSDCLDVIKNFMCLSQSRLSISITWKNITIKGTYVLFFTIFATICHTRSTSIQREIRYHRWPVTTSSTASSYFILLRKRPPKHLIWL